MNRVVNILMERDGCTKAEAKNIIDDVRGMMEDCEYDPDECEDIFCSELGLELDYLLDIL